MKCGALRLFLLSVLVICTGHKAYCQLNIPPVANNDTGTTLQNTPIQVNVVANDSDLLGSIDASTVDLNTGTSGIQNSLVTAQGSYQVNTSGIVTYTPANNFTGTATISYTVNDNQGAVSNVAQLAITVNSVPNQLPVANNDNAATNQNTPVTINVTANDSDPDGTIDPTQVDLNTGMKGIQSSRNTTDGKYSVDAAGNVTYTPTNTFTGTTSIPYTVNDNDGGTSNAAMISVKVNKPPVAVNDAASTSKNTLVTLNVVINDTDTDGTIDAATVDLNVTLTGIQNSNNTAQGSFSVNGVGIVSFTPANNFTGAATITYVVNDNSGATSNAGTVTITVNQVNVAPHANDDVATTASNTNIAFNITANDTDSDGTVDPASVDLNTDLAGAQKSRSTPQGNFAVDNAGKLTYVPANNFSGKASNTYVVSDNSGAVSNAATISVTVTAAVGNIAPVAINDNGQTVKNKSIIVDVVANDTDSDGTLNPSTLDLDPAATGTQKSKNVAGGSFAADATGKVTFTPALNFVGTASDSYTVNDNAGAISNAATLTIVVSAGGTTGLPAVTQFETDTLHYDPAVTSAVRITSMIQIEDPATNQLASAEIGFEQQSVHTPKDQLQFKDTLSISGQFTAATGVMTLHGNAPIASYVQAIRTVTYRYAGTEKGLDPREIYITVSDGNNSSVPVNRSIVIDSSEDPATDVDIPSAFTPNGDGANETWKIRPRRGSDTNLFGSTLIRVYSSRGELVFETTGLGTDWDGMRHGKPLPADSYYYTIDFNGVQGRRKGIVSILR